MITHLLCHPPPNIICHGVQAIYGRPGEEDEVPRLHPSDAKTLRPGRHETGDVLRRGHRQSWIAPAPPACPPRRHGASNEGAPCWCSACTRLQPATHQRKKWPVDETVAVTDLLSTKMDQLVAAAAKEPTTRGSPPTMAMPSQTQAMKRKRKQIRNRLYYSKKRHVLHLLLLIWSLRPPL